MSDPTKTLKRRTFLSAVSLLPACGGGEVSGHESADAATATATDQSDRTTTLAVRPPPLGAVRTAPVGWATSPLAIHLVSQRTGNAPFAFGHAFRQGDLPTGRELEGLQLSVKSRWPDGSVRVAVIAGANGATAGEWLRVGLMHGTGAPGIALTTAELKTRLPHPVEVTSSAHGIARWAGEDWNMPHMTWVSGPLMSSWIYRKPVGADAHLVAWLEVRLWVTGEVEVLPWIENGYLTGPNHVNKKATFTFAMGGSQRFSALIDLPNFCRTPLLSGTALSHWLGPDPGLVVRHDKAYLQSTELVPTYGAIVPTTGEPVRTLPASYTPLQQGSYPNTMGDAGADKSIGLLPEWDVVYLTTSANEGWSSLQRNAYSAGRYGLHLRDALTQQPLRFSQHPRLALVPGNNANISSAAETSSTGTYTSRGSGTVPASWATSHHPSVGYLAALVTGRFYHVETVQFAAGLAYLKQNDAPTHRDGAKGLLRSYWGANTVRGAAWSLRTLVQAMAITPDDNPLKAEYASSWAANIDYYHARYVAQPNNPQGWVTPYSDNDTPGQWTAQPWMDDFFTAAIGYGKALSLGLPAPVQARLDAFFQWKAQAIVGRLGAAGATEFLYRDVGQYMMPMAPFDSDHNRWHTGSGPWFKNWGEVWAASNSYQAHGGPKEIGDTSIRSDNGVSAGSYFANAIPAIAYAVRWGVAGAVEGWQRLRSASNWPQFVSQSGGFPVFHVVPASYRAARPAWRNTLAQGTWTAIGPNTIDSLNPRYKSALNPIYPTEYLAGPQHTVVDNWNGACWVENDLKLYVGPNGGHGDYAGNETYIWDAATGAWSMGKPPTGSLGFGAGIKLNDGKEASGTYADGRVRSYHSYSNFAERRGKAWFFGGSVYSIGAGQNNLSRIWEWGIDDWVDRSGFTIGGNVAGGVCYDSKQDLFWIASPTTSGIGSYDPNGNAIKHYNVVTNNGNYVRPVYDPVRHGIMMFTSSPKGGELRFISLPITRDAAAITPAGTPPPVPSRGAGAWGAVYDPDKDRYLVWTGGGTIYVLTPPPAGTNPATGAWMWSTITPAAGGVSPGAATERGVYGRFWYSSLLRCCGVVNATTQKMHVFALE